MKAITRLERLKKETMKMYHDGKIKEIGMIWRELTFAINEIKMMDEKQKDTTSAV
jgi:hypothetical protein